MGKVSVIIPNYNHSSFLEERILSVLNQTYENFEVIILDDCSTDSSREIIERYKNSEKVCHVIYNQFNSGSTFIQWHRGVTLASGEYLWIAESDDSADSTFLEKTVDILEQDIGIGLVYTDAYTINSDGIISDLNRSAIRNKIIPKWSKSYTNNGETELMENLSYWCSINNVSSVLFRKKNVELSSSFIKFKYAGDWLLYVTVAFSAKISYLHLPLAYYREHEYNSSKNRFHKNRIQIENFIISSYCFNRYEVKYKMKYSKNISSSIFSCRNNHISQNFYSKIRFFKTLFLIHPIFFVITLFLNQLRLVKIRFLNLYVNKLRDT
jgi:glycosyltransferase involved in cell wall biosynthesis